jgi:hypothetical protein
MVRVQLLSITIMDTMIRFTVHDTIIHTHHTSDIMAIRDIEPAFTSHLDGAGDILHSGTTIRITRSTRADSTMEDIIRFMDTAMGITTIST